VEILQLSALMSLLLCEYPATEFLSIVNSTTAPSLSASLAKNDSTVNPQLNFLAHEPTTSLHITQLTCHSGGLESSLHSLGADPTENTASNSHSIVVMGDCLAIARISLTCTPAVAKQRMFLLAIVAHKRYYILQYGEMTSNFGQGNETLELVKAETSWKPESLSNFQQRPHAMKLVCNKTPSRIFDFVCYEFNKLHESQTELQCTEVVLEKNEGSVTWPTYTSTALQEYSGCSMTIWSRNSVKPEYER
jgi:hypothetical protein